MKNMKNISSPGEVVAETNSWIKSLNTKVKEVVRTNLKYYATMVGVDIIMYQIFGGIWPVFLAMVFFCFIPAFGEKITKSVFALFLSIIIIAITYGLYDDYFVNQKGLRKVKQAEEQKDILITTAEDKDPAINLLGRVVAMQDEKAAKALITYYNNEDSLLASYDNVQRSRKKVYGRLKQDLESVPMQEQRQSERNMQSEELRDPVENITDLAGRATEIVQLKYTQSQEGNFMVLETSTIILEPHQITDTIKVMPDFKLYGRDLQIFANDIIIEYDGKAERVSAGQSLASEIKEYFIIKPVPGTKGVGFRMKIRFTPNPTTPVKQKKQPKKIIPSPKNDNGVQYASSRFS